ncbi:MAG TPA: hypothetical protein VGI19_18040 [Candidatus Cybelea sp.]
MKMLTKRLTRKKPAKRWEAEIVDILEHARKSQADIARELAGGYEPSKATHEVQVSRFLKGARTPTQEYVQRIDRAVAALVGPSATQSYLDAHARFHGLLDPDPEALLRDELGVFDLIGIVATPHWERFVEATGDLSDDKRRKFLVEVHRLFGKLVFEFIDGHPRFEVAYRELRKLFCRYDIDLDALLRGEGYGTPEQLRFNALYRTAVAAVLAKLPAHPSPHERLNALHEIERLSELHPIFAAVKSQGPRFLVCLWQAIESGEPFRWPPSKSQNKNRKGNKS